MRSILTLLLAGFLVLGGLGAAQAQDSAVAPDADHAKRVELANEMHKIRPVKEQVQEAVDQVSHNLSPADRDSLNRMVEKYFDYTKLDKISTDAMVKLFTVAELQKMVDYYGSPEAKSIEKKLPEYKAILQPAIIRMLDAAMIDQRTGDEAPPPNVPKAGADKSAAPAH